MSKHFVSGPMSSLAESERITKHPAIVLRNLLIDLCDGDINRVLGHVLTVIDASISDSDQRKAVKDLIKNGTWNLSLFNQDSRQILYEFLETYCMNTRAELSDSELERSFFGEVPATSGRGGARYRIGYFANLPKPEMTSGETSSKPKN